MQNCALFLQQSTQCFSLQNSGSHLPCWPLCSPVLSYQPPGSGQCAFATLSTSIYPVFLRLSGGYSVSVICTNVTKSLGQTKTVDSLWKEKYFVTCMGFVGFPPFAFTPVQKSWAIGTWGCDLENKIRDFRLSFVQYLKLILCDNCFGSGTSLHVGLFCSSSAAAGQSSAFLCFV